MYQFLRDLKKKIEENFPFRLCGSTQCAELRVRHLATPILQILSPHVQVLLHKDLSSQILKKHSHDTKNPLILEFWKNTCQNRVFG